MFLSKYDVIYHGTSENVLFGGPLYRLVGGPEEGRVVYSEDSSPRILFHVREPFSLTDLRDPVTLPITVEYTIIEIARPPRPWRLYWIRERVMVSDGVHTQIRDREHGGEDERRLMLTILWKARLVGAGEPEKILRIS